MADVDQHAHTLAFQGAANRVVRALLRTPLLARLVGARLLTLYVVGRKSGKRYTVPVAIALFRGQYQVPWGQILAGALIATVPVAAVIFVAQRRIVAGLTSGAVKG